VRAVVVTPTYNEAENIKLLVDGIHTSYPGLDVVVVDDGSPDGTGEIARGLEGVHVIQRSGKLGLGTAYVEGFTYALNEGYDRIGGMDADLSHDPAVLPDLFGILDEHDVGVGARYIPGGGTQNWGIHRKILSGGSNLLARTMLRVPAHDITSGYRSYRREVLEAIELTTLKSDGYAFLVELLYRAVRKGFTVGEVPITFADRQHGESKMSKAEIVGGVMNLFRLRFGK
jgi:dolichol-phosphate mannosyltransferase